MVSKECQKDVKIWNSRLNSSKNMENINVWRLKWELEYVLSIVLRSIIFNNIVGLKIQIKLKIVPNTAIVDVNIIIENVLNLFTGDESG